MKYIFYLFFIIGLSACGSQKNVQKTLSWDDISYPYPVQKIQLDNGMNIAYMDEGLHDQTLLFIHGLGSYAPAWKKNIESLKASYRCIAIDLPGYGKSSKGKYDVSMTAYAEIIQAFITKLNLKKVILVGHSMGGQIAIMTALAYPDQIDQLILVAPAGFETFTPGQKQWFREILTPSAVKYTSVDQIKSNLSYNFYNMPADAYFMIDDRIAIRNTLDFDAYCYIIPECVIGMVDEPVIDHLSKISQPTLIIFGKEDNLIPNRFLNGGHTKDIAKIGLDLIPNSQLHLIAKAGHFVQFEQSDLVNEYIQNFITPK